MARDGTGVGRGEREDVDGVIDLEAIRARRDAAKSGPWHVEFLCGRIAESTHALPNIAIWTGSVLLDEDPAPAEFIAHARQDIDDLLAEVDRLRSDKISS